MPKAKEHYTQAQTTPSRRHILATEIPKCQIPRGLSPLAAYIEENRDTGIPIEELTLQFQNYDCPHKKAYSTAETSERSIITCPDCGIVQSRPKRARNVKVSSQGQEARREAR